MTQKLTEEQQRAAHKIIVANRGIVQKKSDNSNCFDCPFHSPTCVNCLFPEFQAENLRRSQAWLDAHITDAEIMAESPREFCERMARTGKCGQSGDSCAECSKYYWATHKITSQEPPKRRPTPEEMVVGATVRVRLWDELVRDGKLDVCGHILFSSTYSTTFFDKEMRQYCGNAYKVIKGGGYPHLDGCGDWTFTPDMLDYVEPEKVVDPKPVANAPKPEAKEKGDTTVKGDVDKLPLGLHFINFRDLLPVDALRIIALEGQVDDLTKKLTASTKLCDRQQRRLRANWEAKRDEEMATREEIIAWFDAGNGAAIINGSASRIRLKNRTDWIPATRGNLKL